MKWMNEWHNTIRSIVCAQHANFACTWRQIKAFLIITTKLKNRKRKKGKMDAAEWILWTCHYCWCCCCYFLSFFLGSICWILSCACINIHWLLLWGRKPSPGKHLKSAFYGFVTRHLNDILISYPGLKCNSTVYLFAFAYLEHSDKCNTAEQNGRIFSRFVRSFHFTIMSVWIKCA